MKDKFRFRKEPDEGTFQVQGTTCAMVGGSLTPRSKGNRTSVADGNQEACWERQLQSRGYTEFCRSHQRVSS